MEHLVLNINGWTMKNDFYSIQDSNNKYSITICNLDGIPARHFKLYSAASICFCLGIAQTLTARSRRG
jgi:hypothetical protein